MSTSFFSSFALITFLLFISCSALYPPTQAAFYNQEKNKLYDGKYTSNEEQDIPLMINPKYASFNRLQRSPSLYPRTGRNSWFRVSTYQNMKPTSGSEEKPVGDNVMRWG